MTVEQGPRPRGAARNLFEGPGEPALAEAAFHKEIFRVDMRERGALDSRGLAPKAGSYTSITPPPTTFAEDPS